MAEGFLKKFDKNLEVFSAGTNPSYEVHPKAIEVMHEVGIDLTKNKPESVEEYLNHTFDYVITVCGSAKESCPTFIGDVKNKLHIGFEDPADAVGTEEEVTDEFRKIRNEIERDFFSFYKKKLKVR
jgi:arsenate reductase